jgi:DHA1 family bicyclomycin/chloramphenicol resistance-like MFS transporter
MTTDSREFVAILATCIGMAALSIDVMLPAFPEIRADFDLAPDSTEVSRLVTAFFMGLAVGQLVYGPLSDRFGRKPMLYAGLVVYAVGAVAATMTTSLEATTAARFVWGAGAAAPRSLAMAMVRDAYEGERMARTMSMVMATFMLVPVFAPALGALGLLVAPWQVVFWIPVVVGIVLALWAFRLPETLDPRARRAVSPASLLEALKAVVTTRETVAYGLAVTMLFAIMTSYIGSSQTIFEQVYDQDDLFPVLFGAIACMLAVGSLLSARLVVSVGLFGLIRGASVYLVAVAAGLLTVSVAMGGEPPLWLFVVGTGILLPGVTLLVPNLNTAAMGPVPHVAGMAAALLGTISTGGGALLGSIVDASFDGSVQPFLVGALVYSGLSAGVVAILARPPANAPEPVPIVETPGGR